LFQKKETDIFKIITVANLVPVKGIEVLIKAVKLLNNDKLYLEILGDDRANYATELKRIVHEWHLQKQITFLGKHNDVRPFFADADLYVIPSKKEGMPMALIEAMSMGIPVLGSNISGVNYVLKDFPELLFEAGNSSILAQQIALCIELSAQERKSRGLRLRDFVIAHFSFDTFIQAHQELYLSIVKK
jgi:glycosyltransferase involved in cell wall biosynthesis